MIVGKSETILSEIGDGHISLTRFSRQSRQWRQLVFQFWYRKHWFHRPDWVALISGLGGSDTGIITTEI
jgi:hypothetical protein